MGLLRGANMKLIKTDKETARALRHLIRNTDQNATKSKPSAVSTVTGPLIVKTLSAISAGDSTQKNAAIMQIRGVSIVATGQTVKVRNIGTGSVPVNTIVITEPCGKLGHCFTRNGNPATAVLTEIERYIKLVGPLPNETGLENKSWNTSTVSGLQEAGWFALHAIWDPGATPTSVDPSTGIGLFAQRMNAVRFAIDDYSTVWNQTLQQHFETMNIPFTGKSSVLPSSDSHLTANFQSVFIPQMAFNHFWYSYAGPSWTEVETTHYRVWIGGVDVTGIVALGTPFQHTYAGGRLGLPGQLLFNRRVGGWLSAAIPSGSYTSQSVLFDIWVTVKTYNRAAYIAGDPAAAGSYQPVCQIDPVGLLNRARFVSGNVNAKRDAGDSYRFTFADNGPGGLSTLSATTGSGWVATTTSAGFTVTHSSIGSVALSWDSEAPRIICTINSMANNPSGAGASVRYLPSSSNYRHRNQNGSSVAFGEWNPQGSTSFQQTGRQVFNVFATKGSANAPASLFSGFPSSITVEKI